MKVLLVNGSPHKKGCTYTALSEIDEVLKKDGIETEFFHVGSNVEGCRACGGCAKIGKCVIDDAANLFLEKAASADGFIFGSPVHFAGPAAALTAFMDRVFYVGRNTVFPHKPAAAIVSCRRGGASAALDRLNKYFTISQMPLVSSRYWNMIHGNTPEEVRQDLEGLQIMRCVAQNMAWLLKCIAAGKQSGIEKPTPEPQIKTNYIR